jgi:TP901 family phage tail tape measure protein
MSDKLLIEVVLTKADTKKAFDEVDKKAAVAGAKTGRSFGKSFSTSVKASAAGAVKSFAALTVAAVGLNKALQLIGASFDNLRGFSRGVAEVNSILPKNQKLTEASTKSLIKFSSAFGTNQQSQARGFYNIVSAGVKGTAKQLETLAIANRAAVAGLVDIDSSAKVLVSSVNAYASSGLTAKEASDALFVSVREGQTTFGELSNFLGNVTSVAASAGLKFDELAGFLAFTTKNGLATDVAVTGLRQILTSIIKPS